MQGKKQRDTAAQDAELRAKKEKKEREAAGKPPVEEDDEGTTDILGESEDQDVIF